jgi:hypothetical protein
MRKPKAMLATMNLLRQTGVLLASMGLVAYWTLRPLRLIDCWVPG